MSELERLSEPGAELLLLYRHPRDEAERIDALAETLHESTGLPVIVLDRGQMLTTLDREQMRALGWERIRSSAEPAPPVPFGSSRVGSGIEKDQAMTP